MSKDKIIDLAEKRVELRTPHFVADLKCSVCFHVCVHVYPENFDYRNFECTNCGEFGCLLLDNILHMHSYVE